MHGLADDLGGVEEHLACTQPGWSWVDLSLPQSISYRRSACSAQKTDRPHAHQLQLVSHALALEGAFTTWFPVDVRSSFDGKVLGSNLDVFIHGARETFT